MAVDQNIPLFFRLYNKLKHDIIRGEIPRGSRIDTIEEIARREGVSQSSVRKSLDLLEVEGLLIRKQGIGSFVPKDLKLYFFDLGRVINSRKTFDEMNKADIQIYTCEWITPNHRIRYILFDHDAASTGNSQEVLKINSKISFPGKFNFIALITYYFPRRWLRENSIEETLPPRDILLCMSRWVLSTPLKMKEALLPFVCTDETAESLGLPDGTPVFHHTVGITDHKTGTSCCWEMTSTANLFYREIELNRFI